MNGRLVRRLASPALAALAALALTGTAAPARGQILDRILEKAEKVKETAEKVGTAVVPISTEQEIEIGRGIAATIAGHYGLVRDSLLTEYVTLVGLTVAVIDPRPDIAYRFAVLDSDEVNAFAAPGGYVFVTRGAIAIMEDESMLAGVLAHELSHVNRRDIIEEIQSKARTALGIEEAAERVDITGEEYLQKAIETGASALFMGLSREDELEADAYSVRTTAAAGYDATAIRRFVSRLDRAAEEEVSLLKKTHPDVDDRLAALDRALAAIPAAERGDVTAAARFQDRGMHR
ncbi:MAG TPA: M48 family metalloprotease [Gemmatimonadota bacterium]|nr:M48 family metalloprotease [Gemmatimonadota bacterium]